MAGYDPNPIIFTQADWRVLDALEVRNLSALKGITDEINKNIIRELSDGISAGEGIAQLSARLQKQIDFGKKRADTVARTETINSAVSGAVTRYEQMGVTEFEFIAASDSRTCDECAQYNGKIYKLTDTAHLPPIHPNCRCGIAPVMGSRDKGTSTEINESKYVIIDESFISSVANAEDMKELKKTFKDVFPNLKFSGTDKLDFGLLKEGLRGMLGIGKEFQGVFDNVTKISSFTPNRSFGVGAKKDTWYARVRWDRNGGFELQFNTESFASNTRSSGTLRYDGDVAGGFHPKNTTINDIPVHEFGHFLEGALVKNKHVNLKDAWLDKSSRRTADDIVSEALDVVLKDVPKEGEDALKELEALKEKMVIDISRYAKENVSEAIAEAVVDWWVNRDNAQILSKEIVRILKRDWSSIGK